MTRLLPRSLLGQVLLALAVTLFLVQGVNGILAWRIEQDRREAELVNTLGLRFVAASRVAGRALELRIDPQARADRPRRGLRAPASANARRFGNADFEQVERFPALPGDRDLPQIEARLAETLRNNGLGFTSIRVVEREVARDPVAQAFLQRRAMRRGLTDRMPENVAVAGIETEDGWEVARAGLPRARVDTGPLFPLLRAAGLTLILSLVLWLVLRRITRPLAELTRRTERFSANPAPQEPLEPRGPEDVRGLIAAHNVMEARIGGMLREKDVMLGAIGHDLKTPLAALRVRIEGVEDETNRARMAETIEEIAATLDDILLLARVGKTDGTPERTDLAALVASVVEEFEDMGAPVAIGAHERIVAPVRVTWLKRGLRNLVTNALRYAGSAEVSLLNAGNAIVLRIDDRGPGIPANRIADMLEPFARGEASRNRATGGAGLGLTIARAVAEQHGGELVLANRPEGGLRAEIRLPG